MKAGIMFALGAGIGSLATWWFVKRKYEEIANEEIASVREYYKTRAEVEDGGEKNEEPPVEDSYRITEEDVEEMNEVLNENRYYVAEKGERTCHPYIITPEQFASENAYYDKLSLSLYTSGEITDEDGRMVYTTPEIENMIGIKNLDSMGEHEPGVLYVRNDILQTDFEIIDEGEEFSTDDV